MPLSTMTKKQKVTTDKERYIELELARDIADRRYVLDISADGDLYCKPCGRILAPAKYSNYKASVNQHLKTANHLKHTAAASPVKKPTRRVVDRSQVLVSRVDINMPTKPQKIEMYGSDYKPKPYTLRTLEDLEKDDATKKMVKGHLIRAVKLKPGRKPKQSSNVPVCTEKPETAAATPKRKST